MAKFTAKIDPKQFRKLQKKLETLQQPIDRKTATTLGRKIVAAMKDNISKGISPITGRRFPAYKNPRKYPGDRKPSRPVNLKLSGKQLKALQSRPVKSEAGFGSSVGYLTNAGNAQKKESGHREGVNQQPKRPTIPIGNESFSQRIQNLIFEIYSKRIDAVLRKK